LRGVSEITPKKKYKPTPLFQIIKKQMFLGFSRGTYNNNYLKEFTKKKKKKKKKVFIMF
jgi:hypothetical protein